MNNKISYSELGGAFAWLAAFWSYAVNKSILWAIFHFLCGSAYLAYLAYRIVFYTNLLPK